MQAPVWRTDHAATGPFSWRLRAAWSRPAVCVLLLGALVLAGAAQAATVSTSGTAVTLYEDTTGSDDNVNATSDEGGSLFFPQPYSSSSTLVVVPPCGTVSGGAHCPVTPLLRLIMDGGNDTVEGGTRGSARLDFQGGDGNDTFRGWTQSGGTFSGGAGNDLLMVRADFAEAGDGADIISGEEGDDELGTLHGGDSVSGGPGIDTVVADSGSAVSLDGQANDGSADAPAAGNVAPDVENIRGSSGGDQLVGSVAPNMIDAGDGGDYVDGSAGADVLLTGAGDDVVNARDGEADSVACGPGRDLVEADSVDAVSPECETVLRPDQAPPRPGLEFAKQTLAKALRFGLVARGRSTEAGTVRLDVLIGGRLAKRLKLSKAARSTVVATSGTKALAAPGSLRLVARFNSRAKRALRRLRSLKASVRLTVTDNAGNSASMTRRSSLRSR